MDHNTAAAGIANELTLLNILRAREGLPLHYTQINRLTGNFTIRGSASINDAIREASTTSTDQTVTTTSATPSTAVTVARQIVEGVDVITPSIGGEVIINPSLDVAVLDNQKFYQGIMAAIPFTTFQNYLNQGFDAELLQTLLIERIDFRDGQEGPNKGRRLFSWRNHDPTEYSTFASQMHCYEITPQTETRAAVRLAPVSRLPRAESGELVGMTLEDLALLDGTRLELSAPIGTSSAGDAEIYVQRPRPERGGANLRRTCALPDLSTPPAEPVYLGNNRALTYDPVRRSEQEVEIEPEIVFRSTEGVIQYLGLYLRAYERDRQSVPLIGGHPIFSVERGRPPQAIVSASILDRRYSVAHDNNRFRNMQIIALVQQLVNLHKESTDRPLTVPVRVLGGG